LIIRKLELYNPFVIVRETRVSYSDNMKILLGSDSESKFNTLKEVIPRENIVPLAVNPDITEQPLDIETTTKGSVNRARNAIQAYRSDFDYSVGMEAGLEMVDSIYNLVCIVSLIDKKGKVMTTQSGYVPLPKEVSDAVTRGEEFGTAVRDYQKKENSTVVKELISRQGSFLQALKLQKN